MTLTTEYYGPTVGKLIKEMLDYDYEKRRNLKDLSIWVNRQLQASRVEEGESSSNETVGQFTASKVMDRGDPRGYEKDRSRVKAGKNNSVYMGPVSQPDNREDRNKIYIHEGPEEVVSRIFSRQNSKKPAPSSRDKNPY